MLRRTKANLDDGCNSELVAGAEFDGILEIPVISPPKELIIPSGIAPFTRREKVVGTTEAIGFFENDRDFSKVLIDPYAFIDDFKRFDCLLPLDCSLYRDAPLAVQLTNIYRSRAIASFYQRNGINIYPLVRWGNEYTYTSKYLPEKAAFLGVPHNSIVCISTYGCIKSLEDKYYFEAGLYAMLESLTPVIVLVYGSMPVKVFGNYLSYAQFIQFENWTKRMHGGKSQWAAG